MSGRGRGRFTSHRSGGRSGRGNRSGRSSNNSNTKPIQQRKHLSDYIFTPKQASEFPVIRRFLLNHIRKSYTEGEDIANALETGTPTDFDLFMPQLKQSTAKTAAERGRENKQFQILYEAEVDAFVKRKETYRSNTTNAYALLWGQCNKALQSKIQTRTDFASAIKNNPINLLKAIEEHSISYQENKYEMIIIVDALKALFNLKQKEDEGLVDYYNRAKTARDVLVAQLGGHIKLTKYLEQQPAYKEAVENDDTEVITKMEKEAFEQLLSTNFLLNADQSKYGSLVSGLATQFSLGQDQYPKTYVAANNVLSNHRFDPAYAENKKKRREHEKKSHSNKESTDKPSEDEPVQLSFAQIEGRCYCCGKKGHNSPKCRDNSKPKSEWYINKTKEAQFLQQQSSAGGSNSGGDQASVAASTNNSTSNTTAEKEIQFSWAFSQFPMEHAMFAQTSADMRNWILLDNESTVDLFCNRDMVSNIRDAGQTLVLATNGGPAQITQKATVADYGEVWFSDQAITNVFSMANMEDRHRITYDSAKESAIIVHTPNKQVKFKRGSNNLYYHEPTLHGAVALVETVEENKLFYTDRQIERAKRARALMHTLGNPSVRDLKAVIKMNSITNCPVTTDDVNLAEKIFGKDVGSIKGKTTRSKPAPVVSDTVEIPPELVEAQKKVDLCLDTFWVNELTFLATTSKRLSYKTAQWLATRTYRDYRSGIKEVLPIYKKGGFDVANISADPEYDGLLEEIYKELGIPYNQAAAKEHVAEIERAIRTIKERIRSVYHSLPFENLTKTMIKYLVMESARKLNYFPVRGGVSAYYSPREILHHQKLDYHKHCSIPMFSYVLATDVKEQSNQNDARAIDALYLRPLTNVQGGHEVLDLHTWQPVKRHHVQQLPMTASVIKTVEAKAAEEGMKGLRIRTKTGHILWDSTWTAGVDYEEDADDDDYEPENANANAEAEAAEDENLPEEQYDAVDEDELEDLNNDDPVQAESNDDDNSDDEVEEPEPKQTKSGRVTRKPKQYKPSFRGQSYAMAAEKPGQTMEYSLEEAKVLATIMCQFEERMNIDKKVFGEQFVTTYSLQKGIAKFGERGRESALKEMKQLHDRVCWKPLHKHELNDIEKKRALESLIFITEKRDGTVKARHCANGSTQRAYMDREETSSPTVSTESVLLTAVIEAEERRDVATLDVPNAFIQTAVEEKDKEGNRTIMKIRGVLVDILCEIDPTYKDYVITEGKQSILYVHITKALYGMLVSAMLFYKDFRNFLEQDGFVVNPYDPCVANKMVNGKQHTVCWHVDDAKSSHVDPKVNTEFIERVNAKYGKIAPVKATRGKIHNYLGMTLDYSVPGQVSIDMVDYVKSMIEAFPDKLDGPKVASPWNENLFKVNDKSPEVDKATAEVFHRTAVQGLFACKRARPDIAPAIAYLTTRVRKPNQDDCNKLVRMMTWLKQTQNDRLTLRADGTGKLRWHADAAFSVHPDFKSHTGGTFSMGKGTITAISRKQGMNTRSSTEAEVVAADEIVGPMLWTRNFLEAQGYPVTDNILYQDNQSAMLLESNGRKSAGKRSRHLNIRYFFVTDQKEKGKLSIEFCPTDRMVADYMTKPTHGKKFTRFRQDIMNLPLAAQLVMLCVTNSQV